MRPVSIRYSETGLNSFSGTLPEDARQSQLTKGEPVQPLDKGIGNGDRRREVTVSDVAVAAGVARATAARALGDYGAVSESVRDRVILAAERLGYRPNALARTMSTGRSNTVGIVVGDIENPFFA